MEIGELGNQYSNVIDKLRNERVGNEVAWETAQPLISKLVSGYPEQFKPHQPTIRQIFDSRRDAFRRIEPELNSKKARQVTEGLDEETIVQISPVLTVVRDIFNIQATSRSRTR